MRIDPRTIMRVTSYARAARFWLFVIAAALAYVGCSGEAKAQTYTSCNTQVLDASCATKPEAYAAAKAQTVAKAASQGHNTSAGFVCQKTVTATTVTYGWVHPNYGSCAGGATYSVYNIKRSWPTSGDCQSPTVWDDTSHVCHNPQSCLAKNDALSSSIQTTARSTNGCDSGCAMSMGTDYTESVIKVPTATGIVEARAFHGKMRYTGSACQTPTKPPESQAPECFDIEGTSTCKRADGKMCHRATNGTISKYGCWGPGETGEKPVDNVLQKKNAGPDAIPPNNLILPSGDTLEAVGPKTTTTETGPGKPTTTTTTQNYQTINGTNTSPTGGPGEGVPGTGPGGTPSGDEGGGGDDGEGETAGPPGGILDMSGRIPGAEDRSIASVIGGFQARAANSPIIGAATGFFDVQAGGTCPTWQIPATDWTPGISVDFWCASQLGPVWTGIGWICICVYSFGAFRWAVL